MNNFNQITKVMLFFTTQYNLTNGITVYDANLYLSRAKAEDI